MALDDHLELANRHVAGGEARIARQIAVIDRLREQGLPTNVAETLLARFENTLALMREHQHQLQAEHDDDDSLR